MTDETATQLLHRLTSYKHDREWDVPLDDPRLVHDFAGNDWEHFPLFYKQYDAALPRIPLPREWGVPAASATEALSGSVDTSGRDVDLAGLARLLHLSAGVTKYAERRGRRWLFRAAGSAGARFPLELRYRERGFRHVYWDAGTMLAQLLSLADSAGVPAALHLRFPDGPAARLVGADGVQEFPVAVIALGGGAPALTATGPKTSGSLDDDGIELPLVTAAQHAGDVDGLGPPVDRGAPVPAPAGGATLDDVIEQRGSIRRLHRDRAVPRDFLETSMAVAMRGVDVPHWVVVHAAGGLAPGLYRWPDLSAPLHTDVSRDDTYRIALEQGLASEAAFVAVLRARPRSCA